MTPLRLGTVLQHILLAAARQQDDELSDGQLLERFAQRRDESAFAALLHRHGPMVLGVCRGVLRQHHDVEDAFQTTFLILAQKAASIRCGASVGGWLHEVAYNVALKTRARAARTAVGQVSLPDPRTLPDGTQTDPLNDLTVRELRQALHEELRKLPEKYRTPLILCYLEGKTQEEAARQLGWPHRRVKDRLSRGRERLRRRLQQRGLAPAATLGTALFAAEDALAAVPVLLAHATVRAAVSGTISPALAALMEAGGALASSSKTKSTLVLLLAVGLLGGTGVYFLANPQYERGRDIPSAALRAAEKTASVPFVAEAGRVIRGTVKAAETGKPQPDAAIWLAPQGKGGPHADLHTKTDAEGRYEIRGIHKAERYRLQVLRNPATGYLGSRVMLRDSNGDQPIIADVVIQKGVIVTGRVVDRATGRPVLATVRIDALAGNRFAQDLWEYSVETGADGTFREVASLGPVLLQGGADRRRLPAGEVEWLGFRNPIADPNYPQYFQTDPDARYLRYLRLDGRGTFVTGNACKVLDLQPGTEVVHQDVLLDRENVRVVKIQDAQGHPLRGAWAGGLRPERGRKAVRLGDDSCPVYGSEAGKPRLLFFYHPERKLFGSRLLPDNENQPAPVRLQPPGLVKGRLLDADGKPLAGMVLDVVYLTDDKAVGIPLAGVTRFVVYLIDPEAMNIHEIVRGAKRIVSDANGAFALDEVVPGRKFVLITQDRGLRAVLETPSRVTTFQVKTGECRDLGTMQLPK